jgi:hypothetical protein
VEFPNYPAGFRDAIRAIKAQPIEPLDWNARRARMEHLRSWQKLADSGHAGAKQVLEHPEIQAELAGYSQRLAERGLI